MNAAQKLLRAKVQLILDQPFFATLALRIKYIPDDSISTAVINGKEIKYNPAYAERITIDQLTGVLAHEVMHTAMLHHTRRDGRDMVKWNKAADYAINPLLISSGFELPPDYLINNEYQNKSAEQIYNLLPDGPPDNKPGKQKEPQNKQAGTGDVEDPPPEVDKHQQEAEMKQVIAQAALIAKKQGKLPGYLERVVNELLQPKIDWREVLARFVAEISKNDYCWKKPALRYLHSGLYLPALESEETGKIILIVDTSISIKQQMINQFAGEVQDIANTFNTDLQVIYVDAKVQYVQNIERDEPIRLHPKGGGGTDFRPGFDYIEQNELQPKAVVYLTDGECHSFPLAPEYPVLWVQFGDAEFDPPFGETVQVI